MMGASLSRALARGLTPLLIMFGVHLTAHGDISAGVQGGLVVALAGLMHTLASSDQARVRIEHALRALALLGCVGWFALSATQSGSDQAPLSGVLMSFAAMTLVASATLLATAPVLRLLSQSEEG